VRPSAMRSRMLLVIDVPPLVTIPVSPLQLLVRRHRPTPLAIEF
jgi:hypothetical protein